MILRHPVDDDERRHLHHVVRKLADAEHHHDDEYDARHARVEAAEAFQTTCRHAVHGATSAAHGRASRRLGAGCSAGSTADATKEKNTERRNDDERSEQSGDQGPVSPDAADRHRRPFYQTAVLIPGGKNDLTVEPVRSGQCQTDHPDCHACRYPASDLPETSELMKGGQESVDAERYQRVDAGELVALAEHRRHLAEQH